MIRLTRQADYGIVVMTHFARSSSLVTHNARDVAKETHLSLPMVSKILKTLARNDLLESHRGIHGGYNLARPADEISLADIITALEGPIGMTDCSDDETDVCDIEHFCPVRGNWQLVNEVVRKAMENISLEHMAGPMPCHFDLETPSRGEPLPKFDSEE